MNWRWSLTKYVSLLLIFTKLFLFYYFNLFNYSSSRFLNLSSVPGLLFFFSLSSSLQRIFFFLSSRFVSSTKILNWISHHFELNSALISSGNFITSFSSLFPSSLLSLIAFTLSTYHFFHSNNLVASYNLSLENHILHFVNWISAKITILDFIEISWHLAFFFFVIHHLNLDTLYLQLVLYC